MIATRQFRVCDVHRLLDFDVTPRDCGYCPMCDAWICMEDQNRWDRRLKAALKRKLEPGYVGLPNYEEVATNEQHTSTGTDN
jgi:hypothetical protein